jgi:hypothetical protein
MSMEKIDELRRVPHTWLDIICNSRTTSGAIAWSVTVKFQGANAQYVHEDLDVALHSVEGWLQDHGALTPKVKPKLKLKRSTK